MTAPNAQIVDPALPSWEQCVLWKTLQNSADPVDKEIVASLMKIMPLAQRILAEKSPAARDFTLHDHAHGFRVAERMAEILGELLNSLSGYELALLLMSAYMHDIGMAPP